VWIKGNCGVITEICLEEGHWMYREIGRLKIGRRELYKCVNCVSINNRHVSVYQTHDFLLQWRYIENVKLKKVFFWKGSPEKLPTTSVSRITHPEIYVARL
jgi:hypothetical protein